MYMPCSYLKLMSFKCSQISCEAMPFEFAKAHQGSDIRLAACAQVSDLKSMIYGHLEENKKYVHLIRSAV